MWMFLLFVACTVAAPNDLIPLHGYQLRSTVLPSARLDMFDGNKTTIQKHPYLVSIMYQDYLFCAGTIVSESWVVTINGCTDNVQLYKYSIVAGTNDGFTGKVFKLKQAIEHENTGVSSFDFSYTCVQIHGKFKFNKKIQAVKLPKSPPPTNTVFTVAGYGATQPVGDYDGKAANWILEGDMTWLDTKKCKHFWKQYSFRWSERMVCAYNKGKTTLCTGDFGDGFVKDGVFYGQFVGSASSEGWCDNEALPNILSNIAPLASWIQNITKAKYEDELD